MKLTLGLLVWWFSEGLKKSEDRNECDKEVKEVSGKVTEAREVIEVNGSLLKLMKFQISLNHSYAPALKLAPSLKLQRHADSARVS